MLGMLDHAQLKLHNNTLASMDVAYIQQINKRTQFNPI